MDQALPTFRFHPDPVQSGCVERSNATCRACGSARGWTYTGPCYGAIDLDGQLCPWCIGDGTAHAKFGTTFHDDVCLPDETDAGSRDEIEERTPGITSFNPVHWPFCCGTPMAYLEPTGLTEIRARHRDLAGTLQDAIAQEFDLDSAEADALLHSLQRDRSPCAHVFRCPTCKTSKACIDFT